MKTVTSSTRKTRRLYEQFTNNPIEEQCDTMWSLASSRADRVRLLQFKGDAIFAGIRHPYASDILLPFQAAV